MLSPEINGAKPMVSHALILLYRNKNRYANESTTLQLRGLVNPEHSEDGLQLEVHFIPFSFHR